jgi:hypothetical protein
MSGAEAARSIHGSPSGWSAKSDLHLHLTQVQVSDFHDLRQGLRSVPPKLAENQMPEPLQNG